MKVQTKNKVDSRQHRSVLPLLSLGLPPLCALARLHPLCLQAPGLWLVTLHYRKTGRHHLHVLSRPFLVFQRSLLRLKLVRYMFPDVKNPLNLGIRPQNINQIAYFSY